MSRIRPKPNLFIVGAPKCGTTAWYEYLGSHPDVFFPKLKEPTYFATDMPRIRLVRSRSDYERLFANAVGKIVVGEASAHYLYSEAAAPAIARYNPDARILIFLRNQEEFLPSLHYEMVHSFNEGVEDFGAAWALSRDGCRNALSSEPVNPYLLNYAKIGCFYRNVERYFLHFAPEQIRVIRFEDWTSDPQRTYLSLLEFLGLRSDGRVDFHPVNPAMAHRNKWLARLVMKPPPFAVSVAAQIKKVLGKPSLGLAERATRLIEAPAKRQPISDELKQEIRRYYQEDNLRLEKLLA